MPWALQVPAHSEAACTSPARVPAPLPSHTSFRATRLACAARSHYAMGALAQTRDLAGQSPPLRPLAPSGRHGRRSHRRRADAGRRQRAASASFCTAASARRGTRRRAAARRAQRRGAVCQPLCPHCRGGWGAHHVLPRRSRRGAGGRSRRWRGGWWRRACAGCQRRRAPWGRRAGAISCLPLHHRAWVRQAVCGAGAWRQARGVVASHHADPCTHRSPAPWTSPRCGQCLRRWAPSWSLSSSVTAPRRRTGVRRARRRSRRHQLPRTPPPPAPAGCAFLTYQTEAAAKAAIAKFHDKVTLPPVRGGAAAWRGTPATRCAGVVRRR